MATKLALYLYCLIHMLLVIVLCRHIDSAPHSSFKELDSILAFVNGEQDTNMDQRFDWESTNSYKELIDDIEKGKNSRLKDFLDSPYFPYRIDPDAKRDLTQLIAHNGYPVERYVVQTEDGFLLDLHRIPRGRKESNGTRPKPAVFLQHGFVSSACDWVMNFPNNSLGFILADNGYDVWMGNSRGSTLSRRHVTLDTDDVRFWDWSFDEMAKYDTTAFLDFILNRTGHPSLHYVGHSQGTTMAFALFAHRPEYQKKIRLFVGLASFISLHSKSPVRYLDYVSTSLAYRLLGRKSILSNKLMMKVIANTLCASRLTRWICFNILFLLFGPNFKNRNTSRLDVYLSNSPAGVSVKASLHLAQLRRDKRFAMFDYGSIWENRKRYDQPTPPDYNASSVLVPTLLFTASNDWIVGPEDAEILETTLPNIQARYNFHTWNHMDFVWGIEAAVRCYTKILQWLPKF